MKSFAPKTKSAHSFVLGSKIKFQLDFKFKLEFWGRWQDGAGGGGRGRRERNYAAVAGFKKLPDHIGYVKAHINLKVLKATRPHSSIAHISLNV